MTTLSVRLNKNIEDKLNFLIEKLQIADKSTYVRQLLEKSLEENIIDFLSEKVGEGEITTWKAAELAGISLRRMMKELKKRNIEGYTEEMLTDDLEFALGND